MFENWQGTMFVNDKQVMPGFDFSSLGNVTIHLVPRGRVPQTDQAREKVAVIPTNGNKLFKFTVKPYMTQKASPEFDFMAKWNNDNPMPLRIMTGWIEKETKGMVYAHLTCMAKPTITCMRCGKELTNPISRAYGIGPECLSKMGFGGIDIGAVDEIREKLVNVNWDGWIIRSAILEQEEV